MWARLSFAFALSPVPFLYPPLFSLLLSTLLPSLLSTLSLSLPPPLPPPSFKRSGGFCSASLSFSCTLILSLFILFLAVFYKNRMSSKEEKKDKQEAEERLKEARRRIDEIDDVIADLLYKRMQCARQAKAAKSLMNRKVVDERREEEVVKKWRARARRGSLSEEMLEKLAELIIKYTLKTEMEE
ncbi:MAG: hypothetical protein C4B55_00115 [Candidatus Methanophagaceae archaeon]|nr:MAG: hypothetical protein C4B55_00115 [Methanophagales archaeon]